jgi:hypothetical protein
MHIYAPNGTAEIYPYSIGQLRKDNPQVSFPRNPSEALLASYDVFPVTRADRPAYDPITQNLTEGTPALIEGVWVQVWNITDASPEEIEQRKVDQIEGIRQQRASAYTQEADPLFFQAQRGEATMDDWSAKIEEIRTRYPYPEE